MSTEGDILAAALLSKAAHDLRNKASALVGAIDLLETSGLTESSEHLQAAHEILGDGEREIAALADRWTAASRDLYSPVLATTTVETLLANLQSRFATPTRIEAKGTAVRLDERVLALVLARVIDRSEIGELVARREESFGLDWLVFEAVSLANVEVGVTSAERALLKMLDAHPVKSAPATVFGFRVRID